VPGAALEEVNTGDGMPTIYVPLDQLVDTCRALRDGLGFALLSDIAPIDFYPREPRYEITYLLASLGVAGFGDTPKRLRVKVRVPGGEAASVPSVSGVWPAANWPERETYDFFGIHFSGHPDLRRILMPEDWEGFPLRKDYPVQIKQPVKTYAPLQVSEEQFVANIEAARDRARRD
jgi:NADH-quinone oxidoreductase subunit C